MSKYIKSIRLKNFQSHRDSSFELSPGLNIIVGPSDQGKSAVIRALRWVMYNEPRGAAFIRSGESRTEVKIVLSNGTVVERIRDESGKVNRYLLEVPGEEPQVFERFNKEVPLEIRKALGISKLVVDRDRSLEINLSRQLEGPFLMEESGATRSKVLGRVANLHIIDAAQRDVLRDANTFSQEASRLDTEIKEIEGQLESFADIEMHEETLTTAERLINLIGVQEDKYSLITDLKLKYETTKAQIFETNEQLGLLKDVETTSELTDKILKRSQELKELEILDQGLTTGKEDINKCLLVLRQTDRISDVESVLERLRSLREEGFILQQARKSYHELIGEAHEKQTELLEARLISDKVANLEKIETIRTSITDLKDMLDKLGELKKDSDNAKTRLHKAEEEYSKHDEVVLQLTGQYGDLLSEAGQCPVCFAQIGPETIDRIKKELA
ncbi:MAG: AAA family ATPase [Candidatus Saccharibacteria bacterium]